MTEIPEEVHKWAVELAEIYKLTVTETFWDGRTLKIWGDYSDEYPCVVEAWKDKDGWKHECFQTLGGEDD